MSTYQQPDASGHFGIYGGSFVSETLTHAISELRDAYAKYQHDPEFKREFEYELKHFVGRPSPVYHAERMSREQGGAHGRDELIDLPGVLDALGTLDAGTHINGQRTEPRPHLQDAIAHVCRCEPTRQNGVRADAWR